MDAAKASNTSAAMLPSYNNLSERGHICGPAGWSAWGPPTGDVSDCCMQPYGKAFQLAEQRVWHLLDLGASLDHRV